MVFAVRAVEAVSRLKPTRGPGYRLITDGVTASQLTPD